MFYLNILQNKINNYIFIKTNIVHRRKPYRLKCMYYLNNLIRIKLTIMSCV